MDSKEMQEWGERLVKAIDEEVSRGLEHARETVRATVPVSNPEGYTRLVAMIVDECFDFMTAGLEVETVVEIKERLIDRWLLDMGYERGDTVMRTILRMRD